MVKTIFLCVLGVLFSCFSAFTVSYIALTTQIGPWMGPTLTLMSLVLCRIFARTTSDYLLPVFAGSLGGIIATAVSFSLPTLYFLDKHMFEQLLENQMYMIVFLFVTIMCAGALAFLVTQRAVTGLLARADLTFPIGNLQYSIVTSQESKRNVYLLLAGIFIALIYGVVQSAAGWTKIIVCKMYTVASFTLPAIALDAVLLPMYIAIGFSAGTLISLPLFVGVLLKNLFVDPVYAYFFSYLEPTDFIFALSSGIVLSGAFIGMFDAFKKLFGWCKKKLSHPSITPIAYGKWGTFLAGNWKPLSIFSLVFIFLRHLQFSSCASVYLIMGALFASYQITVIAGKIGLALLGRFATYVLVPGVMLFGYSHLQVTFVALFVELCGGIATDYMFSYKTAQLACIDRRSVFLFQVIGLIAGACATAYAFYFLVTSFQLGSEQLCALRGLNRALLMQAVTFNYVVLALGVILGFVLKRCHVNPMFVLSGLLMAPSLSIMLMLGGFLAYMLGNNNRWEPLFSGIYSANALSVLIKIAWRSFG